MFRRPERRAVQRLTQQSLAKRLSSSQSRIAKMEAADSSVSVDLHCALFALGAKPKDIAKALHRRKRASRVDPSALGLGMSVGLK